MGLKEIVFKKYRLIKEMQEPRPLPLGVTEFHEWSDRIIKAAMLTATPESQKFALSDMILHLNPTEDHKDDAFFIKTLRKTAINQVADQMRQDLRNAAKARYEAEMMLKKAAEEKEKEAILEKDFTGPEESNVLENASV